jgi:hypothetical protein
MKTKQPILLFRDNAKLLKVRLSEQRKRELLNEIKDVVQLAMGTAEINYSDLISNGTTYLIDSYIKVYSPGFPSHLDKQNRFLSDTNTNVLKLEQLIYSFNTDTLSNPTITDAGELVSNVNESAYDVYLDEAQREFYETVTAFKDILNKVQKEVYPYQNYHEVPAMLTKFLTFDGNFNQGTLRNEMFKTANNGF